MLNLQVRHQNFQRYLLRQLPRIQVVNFSINSLELDDDMDEVDNRYTFDNWKQQQQRHLHVISIFYHPYGRHARFTHPYVFESLESRRFNPTIGPDRIL
jgi:hypothetical protein